MATLTGIAAQGTLLVNLKLIEGSDAVHREPVETDEDVLTFEIADDAVERAAAPSNGQATTIAYCTQWYDCGWPL